MLRGENNNRVLWESLSPFQLLVFLTDLGNQGVGGLCVGDASKFGGLAQWRWILGFGEKETEEYPCPIWCLSYCLLPQATLHSGIIAGALGPHPFGLAWGCPYNECA